MTIKSYKFTDNKKKEYLELLRHGGRRYASAKAVGVTPQTVNAHVKDNPEFAKAVDEAEMEANEQVEDALFMTATSGNVTAMQVWLYNRAPERWADKRQSEHKISGKPTVRLEVNNKHVYEITQRIINDKESVDLAEQLLRRAANSNAGSLRLDDNRG